MEKTVMVLMLVLSLWTYEAMAQQPQNQQDLAGLKEPPPQAYEDCKGKKSGDTVEHTTREGKVAATCVDSPKGLVARPGQMPNSSSESRIPPQPAIDACTGKSDGTTCNMNTPGGAVTGICVYTPDRKYFACHPGDMKQRAPQQGLNK
ncbi:hypothetical protein [Candidatus Magnetominusculus dajiuhuensis]|uniref:hypothetical protein n=1 Tax=Candidatus Magnetominusculus dajiuhuensis TaxID=3137712 RepID=UPI003B42EFCA